MAKAFGACRAEGWDFGVAASTEFVQSYVNRFSPQIQGAWRALGYPLTIVVFVAR